MIDFHCEWCKGSLRVEDHRAGLFRICEHCDKTSKIPSKIPNLGRRAPRGQPMTPIKRAACALIATLLMPIPIFILLCILDDGSLQSRRWFLALAIFALGSNACTLGWFIAHLAEPIESLDRFGGGRIGFAYLANIVLVVGCMITFGGLILLILLATPFTGGDRRSAERQHRERVNTARRIAIAKELEVLRMEWVEARRKGRGMGPLGPSLTSDEEAKSPRADGGYHRIVCSQAVEQGNRSIIPAYEALATEYAPELVMLLGIGGSIHKDVGLCDVVIGTQVVYYDKRKEKEEGTSRRGESYKIEPGLLPQLNHFFVQHCEPASLPAAEGSPEAKFRLHRGPIGSGEAVVGFRDAEVRRWLTAYNDKTLALETEAGGLAQAFYEQQLRRGYKARGYLVIRGISDHMDAEKSDTWRQPASDNAMSALVELLRNLPPFDELFRREFVD